MKIDDDIKLHSRIIEEHDAHINELKIKTSEIDKKLNNNQYAIEHMDKNISGIVDNQRELFKAISDLKVELAVLKNNHKHWIVHVKDFVEIKKNWILFIAIGLLMYKCRYDTIFGYSLAGIFSSACYEASKIV